MPWRFSSDLSSYYCCWGCVSSVSIFANLQIGGLLTGFQDGGSHDHERGLLPVSPRRYHGRGAVFRVTHAVSRVLIRSMELYVGMSMSATA